MSIYITSDFKGTFDDRLPNDSQIDTPAARGRYQVAGDGPTGNGRALPGGVAGAGLATATFEPL